MSANVEAARAMATEAVKRVLVNAAMRSEAPSPLLLVTAARGNMDEELGDLRYLVQGMRESLRERRALLEETLELLARTRAQLEASWEREDRNAMVNLMMRDQLAERIEDWCLREHNVSGLSYVEDSAPIPTMVRVVCTSCGAAAAIVRDSPISWAAQPQGGQPLPTGGPGQGSQMVEEGE